MPRPGHFLPYFHADWETGEAGKGSRRQEAGDRRDVFRCLVKCGSLVYPDVVNIQPAGRRIPAVFRAGGRLLMPCDYFKFVFFRAWPTLRGFGS